LAENDLSTELTWKIIGCYLFRGISKLSFLCEDKKSLFKISLSNFKTVFDSSFEKNILYGAHRLALIT